MTRRWVHWLPAAVVPALVGVSGLVGTLTAGATAQLPERSPEQVLAMVAGSTTRALSGTVAQSSSLGLPALPSGLTVGSTDAATVLGLLTGSHTARVYVDGPTNVRVQVLEQLAERDVVRHGSDVWTYDSSTGTVTHLTIPTGSPAARVATPSDAPTPAEVPTPGELAGRLLAALDPSSQITVGRDTRVAGRSAYDLVLTPRTADTLVASVAIAVDSGTGVPLRVQVFARGQDTPAFSVGFTSVSFAAPAPALFDFVPPPGAVVHERTLPATGVLADRGSAAASTGPRVAGAGTAATIPTISGSGWATVLRLPAGTLQAGTTVEPLIGQLTHAVPGGRALTTSLVSVLITPEGSVLVGAVPIDRLEALAEGR